MALRKLPSGKIINDSAELYLISQVLKPSEDSTNYSIFMTRMDGLYTQMVYSSEDAALADYEALVSIFVNE